MSVPDMYQTGGPRIAGQLANDQASMHLQQTDASRHVPKGTHLFLDASKVGSTQSTGAQEGCRHAFQGQQCLILVHLLPNTADQKAVKPGFYSLQTQTRIPSFGPNNVDCF